MLGAPRTETETKTTDSREDDERGAPGFQLFLVPIFSVVGSTETKIRDKLFEASGLGGITGFWITVMVTDWVRGLRFRGSIPSVSKGQHILFFKDTHKVCYVSL